MSTMVSLLLMSSTSSRSQRYCRTASVLLYIRLETGLRKDICYNQRNQELFDVFELLKHPEVQQVRICCALYNICRTALKKSFWFLRCNSAARQADRQISKSGVLILHWLRLQECRSLQILGLVLKRTLPRASKPGRIRGDLIIGRRNSGDLPLMDGCGIRLGLSPANQRSGVLPEKAARSLAA